MLKTKRFWQIFTLILIIVCATLATAQGYHNYLVKATNVYEKSELTTYENITKSHSGKRTEPVSKITIHFMSTNWTGNQCADYFAKGAIEEGRQASSNYCISDKDIALSVPEDCRAWTSASEWNDQRAITIECSNQADSSLTDATYDNLIKLCADICQRYDIDPHFDGTKNGTLTCHYMFSDTECPGAWLKEKHSSGELEKDIKAAMGGSYKSSDKEDNKNKKDNNNSSGNNSSGWFWGRDDLDVDEDNFLVTSQQHTKDKLGNVELTDQESAQLGLLKQNINQTKEEKPVNYFSVGVAIIGLAICLYAVLLVLGYAFDRANTLVDTSIVNTLTFHKVQVMENDRLNNSHYQSKEGTQYLSKTRFFITVSIIFILGIALLTGFVQSIFTTIALWFSKTLAIK